MHEREIPYQSIIMRCDTVDQSAFRPMPEHVWVKRYEPADRERWADIQLSAGAFEGQARGQAAAYFTAKFGGYEEELKARCLFLVEKASGAYIGSCMAWFGFREGQRVPVLHWLAVKDAFAGRGYARLLIGETMRFFAKDAPGQPVYLHTQPSSYRAIKLYYDFGFRITKADTYGGASNDCAQALEVLKACMTAECFEKIRNTI